MCGFAGFLASEGAHQNRARPYRRVDEHHARAPWPRQLGRLDRHKLADVLAHETLHSLYRDLVSHWKPPLNIVLADGEPSTTLDSVDGFTIDDPVARMMLLDLVTYLPDDILAKVDRAAMSVSLETRIPGSAFLSTVGCVAR